MANVGVVPPVLDSDVGRVRVLLGDVDWVPLPVEPVEPPEEPPVEVFGLDGDENEDTYGVYVMFSDAEIEVFLDLSESVEGAVASAFMQLATAAALEAKQVKDYDLQVDSTKRASELRYLAEMWRKRADSVEGDIFEVFDNRLVIPDRHLYPELTPYSFKRW